MLYVYRYVSSSISYCGPHAAPVALFLVAAISVPIKRAKEQREPPPDAPAVVCYF